MAGRFTFTEISQDISDKLHDAHKKGIFDNIEDIEVIKEKMREMLKEEFDKIVIWSINTLIDKALEDATSSHRKDK